MPDYILHCIALYSCYFTIIQTNLWFFSYKHLLYCLCINILCSIMLWINCFLYFHGNRFVRHVRHFVAAIWMAILFYLSTFLVKCYKINSVNIFNKKWCLCTCILCPLCACVRISQIQGVNQGVSKISRVRMVYEHPHNSLRLDFCINYIRK